MEAGEITNVVVVGSGVMGAGIAQVFAQEGFSVALNDVSGEVLEKAKGRILDGLSLLESGGLLSKKTAKEAAGRISYVTDIETVKDVDMVMEAVWEKIEIKHELFKKLDGLFSPGVILASNTSGISISRIASVTKNPGRVVGMHWWNPPYIIPVIEVIRGEQTEEMVIRTVRLLVERLKKKPVMVNKDVPGFLGNRMQYALMREAVSLLENGVATAEDIDTMVKAGFGFKFPVIGPLETIDMAGMDIFYNVSKYLYGELDDTKTAQKIVEKKAKENKLGQKTGEGFYDYSKTDIKSLNKERVDRYIKIMKDLGY
ncbi:MAG: 3-hydroxyacyl-CoA dehydrogenase family protein [Spirochaetes bacterium]|nr:3-hydroxyacyl-CoA dehydrogenase family protein [Spirochaetota bacterium]